MSIEDAKQLIMQAFEQARAAGKHDWYRMTSAVLKNRMLSLTGNAFDEGDYGATNFMAFISRYRDFVDIDESRLPPVIELRTSELGDLAHAHAGQPPGRSRIRSDLWRAVLDYSSGTEYVWDAVDGQVRPSQSGEDSPVLPIVSKAMHQQWRTEFIESVADSAINTLEQEERANTWVRDQLPTSKLPPHLISVWNGFLRDKVQQHLLLWFKESGLVPPGDMITHVAGRATRRSTDTEVLRQFILQVVGLMTEQELTQLNLPSRAVLRVTRRPRT